MKMNCYENAIKEILIHKDDIRKRVEELAEDITKEFQGEPVVVVTILRGSMIFVADLVRELNIPVVIDTMAVSSYYNGTETTGKVKINKDLDMSISEKNVLIVEDIVDSGVTLNFLKNMLEVRGAKKIKTCSLLNKPYRRKMEIDVDFVGFDIDDYFVVGYGLDFNQEYRNYPHVAFLEEKMYMNQDK